ncbi:hypothetical protein DGWBC_0421 [Dehalogenimonas sp. WBC-2]|nr:hypothetical protein DGWBC_0421 [Dehalogenimonas sp. WBC-2]
MHIWTNRPYEAMWDHLDFLAQPANVKRLLMGEIDSKRSSPALAKSIAERKAPQVGYSIRQGHEYFKAADSVSIVTSPLLYYYGMLSLTKALLVANNESLFLENLKYHGLDTRPKNESQRIYCEDPSLWSIEEEYANINDGVFKELAKYVHRFNFPNDATIKYFDLLAIEPEISNMFQRYYHIEPRTQYLYTVEEQQDPYRLMISPSTNNFEQFEAKFPAFKADFERSKELKHGVAIEYSSKPDRVTKFPDYFGTYQTTAGGRYIVNGLRYEVDKIKTDRFLFPEVCDFITFFILSTCVRYKQEYWNRIIEGKDNGALGIIALYVNIARSRFPNFVLDQLFGERFSFGAGARLA